ncbi:MAG: hypothetical protein LC789_17815 [Actinobacteria bacterium]|nr:hypothetical protein [Actinomycetota bacterium]
MTEANPADLAEDVSPSRDAAVPDAADLPLEFPEADAAEQAVAAAPGEHLAHRDLPLESPEADAAEQAVVVETDEDEYR